MNEERLPFWAEVVIAIVVIAGALSFYLLFKPS
jgi:hypothetical protein